MKLELKKGYQSITVAILSVLIFAASAMATYDAILKISRGGTGLTSVGAVNTLLSSTGSALTYATTVNIPVVENLTQQNAAGTVQPGFNYCFGTSYTLDLPDASTMIGQTVEIKSEASGTVTIAAAAGDSIDSGTTYLLDQLDQSVTLISVNGSSWFVK